jgi:hypothetical protein
LTETGRIFDLALDGNGFFAPDRRDRAATTPASAPSASTRTRTSSIRPAGCKRPRPDRPAGQLSTSTSLFPPRATDALEVKGNLPAVVEGPLARGPHREHGLPHRDPRDRWPRPAPPRTYGNGIPNEVFTMEVTVNGGAPQLVTVQADATGNARGHARSPTR